MSASVHQPATPPPPRPAVARPGDHPDGRGPEGPNRSRLLLAVGAVAMLAMAILLIAVFAGGKTGGTSDSVKQPAQTHSIAGTMAGQQAAQFEIVSGAESITVRTEDLGSDLYRASTPDDSSLLPSATTLGDKVQLTLTSGGGNGPASVEVLLNAGVTWQLRLAGGGMKETIDLSKGKVSVLELGAGAGDIEVSLPKATGTLAVRLTGGAGNLKVHLPAGQPVQCKVDGAGAGTATIDGKTTSNVKAGTELTQPEWAKATDKYSIEATVGVSSLVVDRV